MTGRDRGWGPAGEKQARSAEGFGELNTGLTPRCSLCALLLHRLRSRPKPSPAPSGTARARRIALVTDDEATRCAAWKVVEAQRDGWSLDTYHPCCLAPGASGPAQKLLSAEAQAPEIILIGLVGPSPAGLACVRRLKALSPDLPVVVIVGKCDGPSVMQGCLAGADGWLVKPVVPVKLAQAIDSVAQGVPALSEQMQEALVNFLHRAGASLYACDLTPRQQEIVGCLAAMLSDKEISDCLSMSMNALHVHWVQIFKKLGVHNRRQAFRKLVLGG
jgi:DNA-binding NarL/FixJ family response regulator